MSPIRAAAPTAHNAAFVKVAVIAYDLGACHRRSAYRKIEFPLTAAKFNPSVGFSICDPSQVDRP